MHECADGIVRKVELLEAAKHANDRKGVCRQFTANLSFGNYSIIYMFSGFILIRFQNRIEIYNLILRMIKLFRFDRAYYVRAPHESTLAPKENSTQQCLRHFEFEEHCGPIEISAADWLSCNLDEPIFLIKNYYFFFFFGRVSSRHRELIKADQRHRPTTQHNHDRNRNMGLKLKTKFVHESVTPASGDRMSTD